MDNNFVPEVFGRLTTLDSGYMVMCGKRNRICHTVQCSCGVVKRVMRSHLVSGHTQSCGCLHREAIIKKSTTHGHAPKGKPTPEYSAYQSMVARCCSVRHRQYKDYGGRGIGVWDTWLGPGGFERWLAEIGPRPSKDHSQDRKDNDRDYMPGNVCWATDEEQSNNRRSNRLLTHEGETKTLAQWASNKGLNHNTLQSRLVRGWSVEKALTTPVKEQKQRKKTI